MKPFPILVVAGFALGLTGCAAHPGQQANTDTYTDASVGSAQTTGGPKVFDARTYVPPCIGVGCKTPVPAAQLAQASLGPGQAVFADVGTGTVNAFYVTPDGKFEYLSSYPRQAYVNKKDPSANTLKNLTVYAIQPKTLHIADGKIDFTSAAGTVNRLRGSAATGFKGTSDGPGGNWNLTTTPAIKVKGAVVAKK